ncbi:GNAT family N-acetyltransferase [Cerasicoccus frondis]|uniref:GNAT family N-acetyltransferase n=1 Tax=Cerasicoccus frondis TaxID=490090 RepID=UPI002852DA0D|nr:GNAT family protein [Cerasicoccus frondis]
MKHFPESLILESRRCRYRIPTLDDRRHTISAAQYPGFTDGMLWEPPKHADELLPIFESMRAAWVSGEAFCFSIIDSSDDGFIGRIAIRREATPEVWNLGFWTHPERQNRGYMTEAAARLIAFGFLELDARDIIARHALWNKASEAVMRKNGMSFRQYLPQGFQKRGQWVEENELGITRESWLANRQK